MWRQMIRDNRDRFNEVIIIFTETYQGDDYRDFVKNAMFVDHVLFVQSPLVGPGEDWRDVAVKAGLLHSLHSEWLWFTEQDFFPLEGFWNQTEGISNDGVRVMGVKDGDRLHPCSLFLKRELLNSLDKNFGIVPDELDHFGLIQKQLQEREEPLGLIHPDYWYHMAGLSHNMRLLEEEGKPNHDIEGFKKYAMDCLYAKVGLPQKYKNLFTAYLNS